MEKLSRDILRLKDSPIAEKIRSRMADFREKGRSGEDAVFKELCFCLLTANYSAEGGIRVQEAIGNGFLGMDEASLARELKSLGYRFPNARARYIIEARKKKPELEAALASKTDPPKIRDWLADNILGLGFKEASHFLRNIGYDGFAIIDFHIIDLLSREGVIEKPKSKSLAKKRYLQIERALSGIASKAGISQGELDLYLWYMETGKILK
ncbi:MAG: N-glycosylase/DNA lyase [Candidatus Micrarchaeota archaeon]